MVKTNKNIEVIAYKGMKYDMTCKGFHYELGKTYKTYKAELCKCGFHACLNPNDVSSYYYDEYSRYFKVKLLGKVTKCDKDDTEVAATEITILEDITDNFDEICKTNEWWKQNEVLDLLYYQEGFARIQRGDGLYNLINKEGKLLSNEWFKYAYYFIEGFARVQRNYDEWNFIDTKRNYLSDEWFEFCGNFENGYADVKIIHKGWCRIDKTGKVNTNK